MHDLVVMSPFAGYVISQRITDAAEIAAIEADRHKLAKCRRVLADRKAAAAPAPAVEVAAVVETPPADVKAPAATSGKA